MEIEELRNYLLTSEECNYEKLSAREIWQNILDKIERALDYAGDDIVVKDSAEFVINYGNTLELDRIDIDVCEIMEHIKEAIDEFVIVEEDEDDDIVELEKGDVMEDINKGLGLEPGGNPYVEI